MMLNIRLRITTKNKFKKNFLSLWTTAWKTIENIRNHKDLKLLKSREKYDKYLMKPNFKDEYPFSKMLFAVE